MDLSVYVDESTVYLDGEDCLVYGAVVTKDPTAGIDDLLRIRTEHGVPRDAEIKWNFGWGTPEKKAAVKEAVIIALQQFTFLINITKGRDKNDAFQNVLKQVQTYAMHESANAVQICFDRDCFSDFQRMKAEIRAWRDVTCTLFARGESDLTYMLQYADVFTGAFGYMVHKQSANRVPEILFREGIDGNWLMRLDEYFYLLLRRGFTGVQSPFDPEREDADPLFWTFDCRGLGVFLNGTFSDRQLELLHEFTFVFKGPMD